jgi:hypothetical protein
MTQDTTLVVGDQRVPVPEINIDYIDSVIPEIPQKSARRVLHELDGTVSKASVHRILVLYIKNYKISVMHH